jgi:type II secretory pathway pseudopilin PulG
MLKRSGRRQAGDTLIEVLLAFAIFGAAAATLTRAMNGGLLEMFSHGQESQVQAQMRGQLAIIQKAHEEEIKTPTSDIWEGITNAITPADDSTAPVLANTQRIAPVNADGCTYSADKNRIYFVTDSGNAWTQPSIGGTAATDTAVRPIGTTPQPNGTSLWIEAEYEPPRTTPQGVSRGYYDFYVKACWSDDISRQLKTVLRLYDPVAPTGEGTSMPSASSPPVPPPPPPPPAPSPINVAGSSHVGCRPLYDLEFNEQSVGPPGYAFMGNPGPYPYTCKTFPAFSTVYACVNYDVKYTPNVVTAGTYRAKLSYFDAVCDTASNETLNVASTGYRYRVEVYRVSPSNTASYVTSLYLVPGVPILESYEFPIDLAPGDSIGFRWWNNRFIQPGNYDPDLVIRNINLVWGS